MGSWLGGITKEAFEHLEFAQEMKVRSIMQEETRFPDLHSATSQHCFDAIAATSVLEECS